jgi:hypothetical protein
MINHRKHFPLYLALFLAFIICCRVLWIQHGWITNDSILYFEMARYFSVGDFTAAHAVEGYSWGFYPALIGMVHAISGLTLQASANLLIIIFFMLLVSGLMRMVSIAGGNQWMQFYAVLLLLGSNYIVGNILPMASRDLGYWALLVHAVNQLILFYQHGLWKHAIYWQILAFIATLFRIEGAIQLLVLPVAGLFVSRSVPMNVKKFAQPYSLLIFSSLLAPIVLWVMHIGLEDLGRVKEIFNGLRDIELNFTQNLIHRIHVMRDVVIGEAFEEYSWFTFLLAYFSIATIKSLSVAGWGPPLLVFSEKYSIRKSMQPVAYKVLLFWMFVSWVIGCLITFKVNLLSGRYVALFGFVLIVFSSFALYKLLHEQKNKISPAKKLVLILAAFTVLAGFISNIKPKAADFYYEIDAVAYVKTKLPQGQQALYASAKQRFYADAPYDGRIDYEWEYLEKRIADGSIRQYAYVVIKHDDTPEEQAKLKHWQQQLIGFQLDKTFYGHKRKKQLLVYKRID